MSLQHKLKRTLENTTRNLHIEAQIFDNSNSENNSETSSKYFRNEQSIPDIYQSNLKTIPDQLLSITLRMNSLLKEIKFSSPVDYIYNPTEYAFNTFAMYIQRYCNSTKDVMFLGMNPGPWGMAQTGVPFGEIAITRDWLQIVGHVGKPARELSARPISGFECSRSEVSGKRFWGLFKELCGTPDKFFRYAITHNYCPLALMKGDGKNITPADVKGAPSKRLMEICDQALCEAITLLNIKIVVGVGRYSEKRALTALKERSINNVKVVFLPHPSPRVVGSEHWQENALKYLIDLDLMKYF